MVLDWMVLDCDVGPFFFVVKVFFGGFLMVLSVM